PPFSTLFPYTTLFRSHCRGSGPRRVAQCLRRQRTAPARPPSPQIVHPKRRFRPESPETPPFPAASPEEPQTQSECSSRPVDARRSEEHTSELQSLAYL